MSMSYGELAYISNITDAKLLEMYEEVEGYKAGDKPKMSAEDLEDYRNAILIEMESRGMPHP